MFRNSACIVLLFSSLLFSQAQEIIVKPQKGDAIRFNLSSIKNLRFTGDGAPSLMITDRAGNMSDFMLSEISTVHFDSITTTAVRSEPVLPGSFSLHQNYPNPFNPVTRIRYRLNHTGQARIRIYNVQGSLIREYRTDFRETGDYEIQWDGQNIRGENVSAGIYLYQLIFEGQSLTKKMILTK